MNYIFVDETYQKQENGILTTQEVLNLEPEQRKIYEVSCDSCPTLAVLANTAYDASIMYSDFFKNQKKVNISLNKIQETKEVDKENN